MRRSAGWIAASLGQSLKAKLSFSGKRLMSAHARNTGKLSSFRLLKRHLKPCGCTVSKRHHNVNCAQGKEIIFTEV